MDQASDEMTDIVVPTLGESVTEATVAKWMKKAGDAVRKDETLVELETDKVSVEVSAPEAGVLTRDRRQRRRDGRHRRNTRPLLGAAGAQPPALPPRKRRSAEARRRARAATASCKQRAEARAAIGAAHRRRKRHRSLRRYRQRQGRPRHQGRRARHHSKTARRAARAASAARSPRARDRRRAKSACTMTRLRQTIARRLKEAQNTAAMLTTFNEADMSAIMAARTKYKDSFEKKHGVKLGFMSFFVKACVAALKEIPNVNAEIDGDDIIYKNFYDIGIAVGTDRGLVVPVVRDADHKSHGRDREGDRRTRPQGARRPSEARRPAGRDVHDLQWRRLWLADVDADLERAAIGHPRHAQNPGPPDRGRQGKSWCAR